MAKKKKKKSPTVIDGFSSVQAVKRAGGGASPARLRHSATRLPDATPDVQSAKATTPATARIGHTAVPVKHEMVCYECDYAFTVSGKIHYAFCPKCKRELDMSDHTIAAEWNLDVRTMGSIIVQPDAVVRKALLVGQNIIVFGDVRQATLRATRYLDLGRGARFNMETISMHDVRVLEGAIITMRAPLRCHEVVVGGGLKAQIHAASRVHILATGVFQGEIYSKRLQVDDGASISATMALGEAALAQVREQQHAA